MIFVILPRRNVVFKTFRNAPYLPLPARRDFPFGYGIVRVAFEATGTPDNDR